MTEDVVKEHAMVTEGQLVMPFYLVCDVSWSMTGDMPKLNEGIRKLRGAIVAQPQVDDVAQIGVITFSSDATVVLPLSQLSEEGAMPTLQAQGGTNYGAAFTLLAQTIDQDIKNLKATGYKVYRPCAFFLTDGLPGDSDWLQTFTAALTYDKPTGRGNKGHPVFVPFGFRDARDDVLSKLAYPPGRGKWFHAKTHDVNEALEGILEAIMTSVISSGMSSATGSPAHTFQTGSLGDTIVSGDSSYDSQWA